jgi:hypothetical protein
MQRIRFNKKFMGVLTGILALAMVLVAGVQGRHAAFADPNPTISGTLSFNSNPAPLNSIRNGVDIGFIASNGVERGARTDAFGNYSADATQFSPDDYKAQLSYNAPYPQENSATTGMPNSFLMLSNAPVLNYQYNSITQNFDFATKTVAVTVKDANGNPVQGREVQVTNVGAGTVTTSDQAITFSAANARLESQGITNANGVATVSVFAGPTYSICVRTGYIYPDSYCAASNVTVTDNTSAEIDYQQPPTISGQVRFNGTGFQTGQGSVVFTIPTVSGDNVVGSANTDASSNYSFSAVNLFARSYGEWLQYNVAYNQNNSAVTGIPNTFLLKSVGTVLDYGYTNVTKDLSFTTSKLAVTVKDANGNPINTHVYVTSTGDNTVTTSDNSTTFNLPNGQGQSSNPTSNGVATVAIFNGVQYNACAGIQNVEYCTPVNINGESTALIAPKPGTPSNLTITSPTMKPVLSWTGVSDAASYKIYRDNTYVGTTTSTTYADTTAADGTHTYFVKAANVVIEGAASNSVNTVVDTARPILGFTAPTSFTGPFTVGPTVTVTGSDSGSGLQILVIHVYNSANQLLSICGTATPTQLAAGTMSCDLSSLPNGTYSIKAGSFDNAGNNKTISSGSFTIAS